MLIHPTVERLRSLGLAAMADVLVELQNNPEAAEMPHADWLGLLIDREVTFRDNRRLSRRLTAAKLRQAATIENVDYRASRGLDRSLFQTLATSQWVRDCNHLAIVGPTGTGKSWLACALGNKACRDGFSVLYKRASRLFADLAQARGEGRLLRLMNTLERTKLIIIDDWGPEPLTADQRRDLLEIVDDRYDKGSLLITSQVPVSQWHDVIADPTLGDAILDRIVHNAHRAQGRQSAPSRRRKEETLSPSFSIISRALRHAVRIGASLRARPLAAAVGTRPISPKKAASRLPAVDLGSRVSPGGKPYQCGPPAPASGGSRP